MMMVTMMIMMGMAMMRRKSNKRKLRRGRGRKAVMISKSINKRNSMTKNRRMRMEWQQTTNRKQYSKVAANHNKQGVIKRVY